MYSPRYILNILCGLLFVVFFQACSRDKSEYAGAGVDVAFELDMTQPRLLPASFNGTTYSVNRILILPFKKTSEAATDDDVNFVPEYTAAKQFDVTAFPFYATKLNLSTTSSYKIMVIGYNRNDYDFSNPTAVNTRFSLLPASSPTLANFQLALNSPEIIPEFFSCMATAYNNNVSIGTKFLPQKTIKLTGNLKRLVAGLSVEVTGVPAFVDSITLVAQQLVTGIRATDGTPLAWENLVNRKIGKQTAVSGTVSFSNFMLPTLDAHKTQLFLDVYYGVNVERYTVKVNDLAGVSSSNSITFTKNQVVNITGDYSKINFGFTITSAINLDDNDWDGVN